MSQTAHQLSLTAIPGIPEIKAGDPLAQIIAQAMDTASITPQQDDVLVLSQKIVSKSEDRWVRLNEVTPSAQAHELALEAEKNPALVELILRESSDVLRVRPGLIIVRHRRGMVLANAGIDQSNLGEGPDARVLLLPQDCDASCITIRAQLAQHCGVNTPVMIIDSVGRAWRQGIIGMALGCAGLPALIDLRGVPDRDARELNVTQVGYADQIASAASLLMGEAAEGRPAVLVRGLQWQAPEIGADALIRAADRDLFS